MTQHSRRRIGEFLILFLYLIIDGYSLWPISHFWALVAGLMGVIALLFLDGEFSTGRIFIAALVLWLVCLSADFFMPPILPEETETHGWLLPGNEPTPPNGCNKGGAGPDLNAPPPQIPSDALIIIAGTNAVWTQNRSAALGLRVGDSDLLFIERDGPRLAINANIFNENGNLAVRIVKNEFHLISGEYSYPERSKDRGKLAVYDKKGVEMLYIDYANTYAILIRGVFTTPDGIRVKIGKESITMPANNMISGNCHEGTGFIIGRNGFLLF